MPASISLCLFVRFVGLFASLKGSKALRENVND